MQVCKAYFKLLKKNLFTVLIFFGIFFILMFIFNSSASTSDYMITKVDAYVEIEEENDFNLEFKKYLEDYVNFVSPKGSVEDCLYWGDIDVYIKIPKDFDSKLWNNEKEVLTIKTTPDNYMAFGLKTNIDAFLNQIKTAVSEELTTKDKAISYAMKMQKEIDNEIMIETFQQQEGNQNYLNKAIFNYGIYVITALSLSIIGLIMMGFKSSEIKRRMNICSLSNAKINLWLIFCNIIMCTVFVLLLFGIEMIMTKGEVTFIKSCYYLFNAILIGLVVVTAAYFLTMLIRSKVVYNALSVIIPLGVSFLCGVFVPKELLSDGVIAVAHALPQYYAVEAHRYIYTATNLNILSYFEIVWPYLIFVAIFIVGTLVVQKIYSHSENV